MVCIPPLSRNSSRRYNFVLCVVWEIVRTVRYGTYGIVPVVPATVRYSSKYGTVRSRRVIIFSYVRCVQLQVLYAVRTILPLVGVGTERLYVQYVTP